MRLNNSPNVSQAAVAARPTCFVSKTLLLPKGTIGRRKEGAQLHFLIKPIYWLFQVIGPETDKKEHRAAPVGGDHSFPWTLVLL